MNSGKQEPGSSQRGPRPLRLFFAIELPSGVKEKAAGHVRCLREALPEVRASWERPEKMHITLKFLGNVEQHVAGELAMAAEAAAETVDPFELRIEGAGSFPPRGVPRTLWLGITDASGELASLYSRLEEECEVRGFPREHRPFNPHVTVARIKHSPGARRIASAHAALGFSPVVIPVTELILVESQLGPQGSRYTPFASAKLGSV